MEFVVGGADMDDYLPLLEEELALLRRGPARPAAGTRPTSPPTRDVPGRRHRRRHVGPARRAPAAAGRRRLRRPREERRRRRHLVREHAIPGAGSTSRTTTTATRSPSATTGRSTSRRRTCCSTTSATAPTTSASATTSGSAPRCCRRRGRTTTAHVDGPRARRRRHDETLDRGERGDQRGRPAQPAARSRTSRAATRSPARRSTPRGGTTTRRSARQARRRDRHRRQRGAVHPRDRRARRAARGVPAHATVARPDARLPRRRARRDCAGSSRTCRTTASGTASGSSGRWATARCPACASIPTGTPNGSSVSALNDMMRALSHRVPRGAVRRPARPAREGGARLPAGAKRILRDNGVWAGALKRDNVDLVTDAIREITPDGRRHRRRRRARRRRHHLRHRLPGVEVPHADEVTGRDGVDLHEHWDGDARAYLGITVPGFPNLFCLYGPNTNIVDQRQHHLLLRVRGALHPRAASSCCSRRPLARSTCARTCTTRSTSASTPRTGTMAWGWST